MNILDVIRQLQELQVVHGDDIKVMVYDHNGDFNDAEVVEVRYYREVKVLVIRA